MDLFRPINERGAFILGDLNATEMGNVKDELTIIKFTLRLIYLDWLVKAKVDLDIGIILCLFLLDINGRLMKCNILEVHLVILVFGFSEVPKGEGSALTEWVVKFSS